MLKGVEWPSACAIFLSSGPRNVHRQIKLPSQVKVCLRGSSVIVTQLLLAFRSHLEEADLSGTNICLRDSDRVTRFQVSLAYRAAVLGTSLLPLAAAFCLSKGREKSKPILCHGEYMPAPRKLVKGSDTGRPTTDWDEDKAEKIFMPA